MIPKSLLTLALLCIVFCIPAPTHAQDSDDIGKVYFATAESLPDDWQGDWEKTADILWELDTATGTTRELLRIEFQSDETPREAFSESEFSLLEQEAALYSKEELDSPLFQHLEVIAVLDAERLLVITFHYTQSEMMSVAFYGFYELQILNLVDGSLTSLVTLDFHPYSDNSGNLCFYPLMNGWLRSVSPNPTLDMVAVTVSPGTSYENCATDWGQTYVIDYSSLPAQVETVQYASKFSWSPDGSMFAYAGAVDEDALGYYVRSAVLGTDPTLIAEYEDGYFPLVVTWLDAQTILYQYQEIQEGPYNLAAYDITTGLRTFSEYSRDYRELDYLDDGEAFLIYGLNYNETRNGFLYYTPEGEFLQYQTLFKGEINGNSRFRHVGLLRWGTGYSFLVIHPDLHTSRLDLSPFVPEGHYLMWVIPGAAEE